MTDKEKIEVMELSDMATIQSKLVFAPDTCWIDEENPKWNWETHIYRVKPEAKYRPFKDSQELIDWWEKHYQDKKRPEHTMPLVWVKYKDDDNYACFITEFGRDIVCVGYSTMSLENLFENYTFLDGKPCGVEE